MLRLSALPLYLCKNSQVIPGVASVCCCRYFSASSSKSAVSPNENYIVSQVYHNRNPRNLEKMALAKKRIGWTYQAPRKDYYHKLVISHTLRNTEVFVEHSSGERVLSASTKEWAIRNQLYSCTDVVASASVGQILAQRCLKSGITCLFFDETDLDKSSEKTRSIIQAFKDANVALTEPDVIRPKYTPGINYDGYNRYAEAKVWKEDYQDI